jgi:predicted acetyltransferase
MSELILRELNYEDETGFRAALEEFRLSEPDWEFAFEKELLGDFKSYVEIVNSWKEGKNLKEGFVPHTFFVAVVGDKIIGRSSIRHVLNEKLLRVNGHIGYGVVRSERGKGHAKIILEKSVKYLQDIGVTQILITCDEKNIASRKTIESNGGVLENKEYDPEVKRVTLRYWIRL